MADDCPRAGRWFGGCNFEGRYDSTPTGGNKTLEARGAAEIAAFFHGITERIYVRDVCTRCGRTIERKPNG